ncbi:MAG: ATP-grasp domain-containing protein [Eubacterium sp.]|nr:ATP-grasp domain-containing protein [Eubacterium sp.]
MNKTIMIISSSLDVRLLTAVKEAKKLGIRTVACVREEDDGSLANADIYYNVNGKDTDKLLSIAKKENINGILGVWDKSALSAAIIADKLGLAGNPPDSIRALLEKGHFRRLQKESGVFCPNAFETNSTKKLTEKIAKLRFPIIMKPVLCSSSFGQTVLYNDNELIPAFKKAAAHSENDVVCVEEFIEDSPLLILESDIFVIGDDIIWDGMHWDHRFPETPLRPVLAAYPVTLDKNRETEFKTSVKKVLQTAGVRLGEFNVEGFFTKEGKFFIIEINPRPAGYYSQEEIELHCGINLSKLLVTTAVGDMSYYDEIKNNKRLRRFVLSYAVFSFSPGIVDHIHIDPSIQCYLSAFHIFPGGNPGDHIEDIHADNRPVGMAIFNLPSEEVLTKIRLNIRELVYVVLMS